MLRHNWRCLLQSDFVYTYLFLVVFNYYLFHKCEAESFNTNSLTRLWKMSESGNRLPDTSTTINKSNTQNSKSTSRSIDNDFNPSLLWENVRSYNEAQTILPFFSELSSTYRAPTNIKNIKNDQSSISPLTFKTYKNDNEGTLESVIIQNYTTSKPLKSSSDVYDMKIFNTDIETPLTYEPSVPLSFRKNIKISTNDDYYDKSSKYSESDLTTRSNPVIQAFSPRMIPVNDYSITEEPASTLMSDPLSTTFKAQFSTENSLMPGVTMTSYRDPGFTVTGRQLSEGLTQSNHLKAKPVQHIDTRTSQDIDGGRKSSIKKKYKKFMLPLLLAYKLKFFALLPLLMGGLVLLAGSTGMAGFFFALFAAVMGLKTNGSHN